MVVDRSKSALGSKKEGKFKNYINYAKFKAHHYKRAYFKQKKYDSFLSFVINFTTFLFCSGSFYSLVIGQYSNWNLFLFLVSFINFVFSILYSTLGTSEKVIRYHYDFLNYSTFSRDWTIELITGVDDRESKVDIELRKCKDKLNELDQASCPLKIPLFCKK